MTPPSWPFRLSLRDGKWVVNKPPKFNPDDCEDALL